MLDSTVCQVSQLPVVGWDVGVCLGFCVLLWCNALLNVSSRIHELWERCRWKLRMCEYLVHIVFFASGC